MPELSYHCSPKGNIEVFEPSQSKGKSLVFSTPYITLAYIFGIKNHNDYKISLQTNPLRIIEMCPNALERFYKNQSAYLYTFNAADFSGRTQWNGEITSDKPVKPSSCDFIPDLQAAILEEEKSERLEILRFPERNKYFNMDEHLASREYNQHISMSFLVYLLDLGNYDFIRELAKYKDNKFLFEEFGKECVRFAKNLSQNDIVTHDSNIIPNEFKEKYRYNSDDSTVAEIILNVFSLKDEKERLNCIDEIKSLNNKELTAKIIFKLKSLSDLLQTKKAANCPIVFPKENSL
ncbi:MAG: hypothetical protein J6W96_01925 [Alphaproteobacteria bacterium]|nr:hypothetical protein [Alphaproteobacteria bacterium]